MRRSSPLMMIACPAIGPRRVNVFEKSQKGPAFDRWSAEHKLLEVARSAGTVAIQLASGSGKWIRTEMLTDLLLHD
jgi:hypothetical protein